MRASLLLSHFLLMSTACKPSRPPNVGEQKATVAPIPQRFEKVERAAPLFVDEKTAIYHTFTIRNDTGRPVQFTRIQQSCACTSAQLGKMHLEQGDQTTLGIEVRLHGRHGPQRFSCTVIDDESRNWVYDLEVTLYESGQFEGNSILHFGEVDPKSECERRVDFLLCSRNPADLDRTINFQSDLENIQLKIGNAVRSVFQDGIHVARVPINVILRAPACSGMGRTTLHARVDGLVQRDWVKEVAWIVRPLFIIEPRQVFFGAVAPGDPPVTRQIRIRREDGMPFNVRSIRPINDAVAGIATISNDRAEVTMDFKIEPHLFAKTFWIEAELETDHPIQPKLRIPIACVKRETASK
jgi:hypothetical protein